MCLVSSHNQDEQNGGDISNKDGHMKHHRSGSWSKSRAQKESLAPVSMRRASSHALHWLVNRKSQLMDYDHPLLNSSISGYIQPSHSPSNAEAEACASASASRALASAALRSACQRCYYLVTPFHFLHASITLVFPYGPS